MLRPKRHRSTVLALAEALAAGKTTSRALTEAALERIADPGGEGNKAFISVDAENARTAADYWDAMRKRGVVPSPLAGLPVSVKDLFNVAGQVTRAGSKVLSGQPPAATDAPVVARLRAGGAVIVGRTNMTEFAYSGLGLNPHYGTPGNVFDRTRIPGGSSSGAGVAVAAGMCAVSLGTDTGGSIRIPSCYAGLVGFKPTQRRIPLDGGVPLSSSLDTYGPLAPSVVCCAITDALLAGEPVVRPDPVPVAGLRIAVIANFVTEDVDDAVASAFSRAIGRLSALGAKIEDFTLETLPEIADANKAGGLAAAEAFAWHRPLLATSSAHYDPRVLARIEAGAKMGAGDYIDLIKRRHDIIARTGRATAPFDLLALPTVAITPPQIASLAGDAEYRRANSLILRNPSLFNFLDRPALTLPIHRDDALPVGLMLVGETMQDRRLLALGRGIEEALE